MYRKLLCALWLGFCEIIIFSNHLLSMAKCIPLCRCRLDYAACRVGGGCISIECLFGNRKSGLCLWSDQEVAKPPRGNNSGLLLISGNMFANQKFKEFLFIVFCCVVTL